MSTQLTPIELDFDMESDCRARLVKMYNAYMQLTSGGQRLKVRHLERWTEYHPGNAGELRRAYDQLFQQCCDTDGLPRLSPARGGPAFLRIT